MQIPIRYINGKEKEQPPAAPQQAPKQAEAKVQPKPVIKQLPSQGESQDGPPAAASVEPAAGPSSPEQEDADYRELYLRAMADMANFRRRAEERADRKIEEERRRLLLEFLEVADNLERALDAQPVRGTSPEHTGLRQGVELTLQGLQRFLKREGVYAIETEGQPFNPEIHEAVATVERGRQSGQVVQEVQKGYYYHNHVLRPARVLVGR
jgi:molecular chaperone GrpE